MEAALLPALESGAYGLLLAVLARQQLSPPRRFGEPAQSSGAVSRRGAGLLMVGDRRRMARAHQGRRRAAGPAGRRRADFATGGNEAGRRSLLRAGKTSLVGAVRRSSTAEACSRRARGGGDRNRERGPVRPSTSRCFRQARCERVFHGAARAEAPGISPMGCHRSALRQTHLPRAL